MVEIAILRSHLDELGLIARNLSVCSVLARISGIWGKFDLHDLLYIFPRGRLDRIVDDDHIRAAP